MTQVLPRTREERPPRGRGPTGENIPAAHPKREFDGEPNEPSCCQTREGYKSWARVLRHKKTFEERVAGYTWYPGSLGQTVEKAMRILKKDSTRAHLLLPSSSLGPHGRCSTVVVRSEQPQDASVTTMVDW